MVTRCGHGQDYTINRLPFSWRFISFDTEVDPSQSIGGINKNQTDRTNEKQKWFRKLVYNHLNQAIIRGITIRRRTMSV